MLILVNTGRFDGICDMLFSAQTAFSKVRGKEIGTLYTEICKLADIGMLCQAVSNFSCFNAPFYFSRFPTVFCHSSLSVIGIGFLVIGCKYI